MTNMTHQVLSAGTLIDDGVKNAAGEDLGYIKELMLDVDHGRIAYAVLGFGGFLGLGEKLFAVPWDALSLDTSDHKFLLNVDRDTLVRAEGFDPNDWPDMADPEWGRRIYSYYGYEPYWS